MLKCLIGAGESLDILLFSPICLLSAWARVFIFCRPFVVPLSLAGVPPDRDGYRAHNRPWMLRIHGRRLWNTAQAVAAIHIGTGGIATCEERSDRIRTPFEATRKNKYTLAG